MPPSSMGAGPATDWGLAGYQVSQGKEKAARVTKEKNGNMDQRPWYGTDRTATVNP